jgi:hypothetical protein
MTDEDKVVVPLVKSRKQLDQAECQKRAKILAQEIRERNCVTIKEVS